MLEMVSSDMEQRTVESGTALTFEPKMTRARTKQAFDSGRFFQAPRDGACGNKDCISFIEHNFVVFFSIQVRCLLILGGLGSR